MRNSSRSWAVSFSQLLKVGFSLGGGSCFLDLGSGFGAQLPPATGVVHDNAQMNPLRKQSLYYKHLYGCVTQVLV